MSPVRIRSSVFGIFVFTITSLRTEATTYDFTGSAWPSPSSATTVDNLSLSSLGASLATTTGRGNTFAEGYVDLNYVSSTSLSGKNISVDLTARNEIVNGDFESTLSQATNGLGGWSWLSTGTVASVVSSPFGTGNAVQFINSTAAAWFQQSFEIDPGELYRISFKYDGSNLLPAYTNDGVTSNDGGVEVRMKTFDSSATTKLSVTYLDDAGTGSPPTTTNTYEKVAVLHSGSAESQYHRYVTVDCDEKILQSGSTPVSFYRYSTTDECADKVYYGQLAFVFTSSTTASSSSYIKLDDINVEWARGYEAEIIDRATGSTIQRSYERTFQVNSLNSTSYPSGITLRIWLRSQKDSESPTLKKVYVGATVAANIPLSTTSLMTVSEPRLGVDMNLPPKSEFQDSTTYPSIQTQCLDSLNSDAVSDCYELYSKYNLTHARIGLPLTTLSYALNSGKTDYDVSVSSTGETYFTRLKEATDAGLDPSVIFYISNGTTVGSIWSTSSSSSSASCSLAVSKPTSGTYKGASDATISEHLVDLYGKTLAQELDGSRSSSTGAAPIVTDFEIFNEPNLSTDMDPACTNMISVARVPAVAETMASSIQTARSDANVVTPSLSSYGKKFFDSSYFTTTLDPTLTPANFDSTNWHPYADTNRPEDIDEEWSSTSSVLDAAGWTGKSSSLSEWGFSAATYDSSCNTTYSRGYGVDQQSKLLARQLVSMLGSTSTNNMIWGQMNNEWEGSDGDCWRSGSGNKTIFERHASSGILGTDSSSPGSGVTQYEPTSAGNSFLLLGKHLGYAEPTADPTVTLTFDNGYQPEDERYFAKFFKTDAGYVLAFWYYRDYQFGQVDADLGETTTTYYQNYLYGASDIGRSSATTEYGVRDYGYEEKRNHTITLTGLPGLSWLGSVRRVDIDSTGTEIAVAHTYTSSTGTLQLRGVPVGERPVLLLITSKTSGNDGLGPWHDPSTATNNSWFIVNATTGANTPAAYSSYTWSFVQGRNSPLHRGSTYARGLTRPYNVSSTKPVYKTCPGNSGVNYGICIRN